MNKPGDDELKQQQEDEAIWSGPAYYINRVWAWASTSEINAIVRLSFAEQGSSNQAPQHRTAVVITMSDAIAFIDLLEEVVGPYRRDRPNQGQTK